MINTEELRSISQAVTSVSQQLAVIINDVRSFYFCFLLYLVKKNLIEQPSFCLFALPLNRLTLSPLPSVSCPPCPVSQR